MKTGQRGVDLVKLFEGLRLEAYRCPAGKWTIGYGHTGRDVYPGRKIDEATAERLLREDLAAFEAGVSRLVTLQINQNKFDALVAFAFNCGLDEDNDIMPEGLGDSTLLKYVNQGKHTLAASEFLKWNEATVNGKRTVLGGLVRRRKAESGLYLTLETLHGESYTVELAGAGGVCRRHGLRPR